MSKGKTLTENNVDWKKRQKKENSGIQIDLEAHVAYVRQFPADFSIKIFAYLLLYLV